MKKIGTSEGAMRRAADTAAASVWLVLVARGAAILAPLMLSLLIYVAADWRQNLRDDDAANQSRTWENTKLIYSTSANLRETVARLEALKDNDEKQDAELLRLRSFGRP